MTCFYKKCCPVKYSDVWVLMEEVWNEIRGGFNLIKTIQNERPPEQESWCAK